MPDTREMLYTKLGRLLESIPPISDSSYANDLGVIKWLSDSEACIRAYGDSEVTAEFRAHRKWLATASFTTERARNILEILFNALANLEFELPPGLSGTFIPVGSTFDAFVQIGRILKSAQTNVLIVDPYMDESILTSYFSTQPPGVPLRLLTTDKAQANSVKGGAQNWKSQFGQTRPLELRLAHQKKLHDRLILVDGKDAWTVTQSFKDLAARSPGEIIRTPDVAQLKIDAYEDIWTNATPA